MRNLIKASRARRNLRVAVSKIERAPIYEVMFIIRKIDRRKNP